MLRHEKHKYYHVIAGAAAACQPGVSNPTLGNAKLAELSAEAAMAVVKRRIRQAKDEHDHSDVLITDAYATVAIAYRRAAAIYTADKEMEQLGTAAVHLVTIANSFMNAQSEQTTTQK
jgi:predicted nucleic acid-binding protein